MRTIIAGTRKYGKQRKDESLEDFIRRVTENKRILFNTLDTYNDITVVLSGLAKGPDTWGKQWAEQKRIKVESYPPDWDLYGTGAGFRRNKEMVTNADRVIAFYDGFSRGTKHTLSIARKRNLEIIEHINILKT